MDKSILTYVYVFALSIFGGTVHNLIRIKKGDIEKFSFFEWLSDVLISAFVGLMTYYLCIYSNIDGALMALFVGITSHQGAKGLALIGKVVRNVR